MCLCLGSEAIRLRQAPADKLSRLSVKLAVYPEMSVIAVIEHFLQPTESWLEIEPGLELVRLKSPAKSNHRMVQDLCSRLVTPIFDDP